MGVFKLLNLSMDVQRSYNYAAHKSKFIYCFHRPLTQIGGYFSDLKLQKTNLFPSVLTDEEGHLCLPTLVVFLPY